MNDDVVHDVIRDVIRRALLKVRHRLRSRLTSWRDRLRPRRTRPNVTSLDHVHRRLELFLTALYGRTISVAPLGDTRVGRFFSRAGARRFILRGPTMASSDGNSVFLPRELAERDDVPVLTRYRLLALEQAERIVRGTAGVSLPSDALERDLYLLREGMTIDAQIARAHRGMSDLLVSERHDALARRPKLERLSQAERAVESRFRELLACRPEDADVLSPNAEASLAWAREMARTIRTSDSAYRGLPLAPVWGELQTAANAGREKQEQTEKDEESRRRKKLRKSIQEEATEEATEQSSDAASDRQAESDEHGEAEPDPQSPVARDSEQTSRSDAPVHVAPSGGVENLPPAIHYDEWNVERGAYVRRAVAVRVHESLNGDAGWLRTTAARHAPAVRRIRHQFERLRARRMLLRRQHSGAELDIDAYVDAAVDRRAGRPLDDRLYIDVRPARRGLAIALLIDASTSTDRRLNSVHRIIDIERVALYLASEALDALGDMFAVYSFGGQGASNVKLSVVKDFNERSSQALHERIGAIEPQGFTRLGAAVRHVTAQLARQSAGHRLLLLLSDGRPHDVDHYQDEYAIEDARQAIFEARASGVFPYCLAVDADAAEYLPRIFGNAGHTVLRQPEHLPNALIAVVNALLARR